MMKINAARGVLRGAGAGQGVPFFHEERALRHWISAPAFWFGRIFCDEPASTSSENAVDRVHFSWNRERALFSFILSMFFTPNRVHFG